MPGPGADAPNVWATSHAIYAIWAGCMGLFAIADVVVICSFLAGTTWSTWQGCAPRRPAGGLRALVSAAGCLHAGGELVDLCAAGTQRCLSRGDTGLGAGREVTASGLKVSHGAVVVSAVDGRRVMGRVLRVVERDWRAAVKASDRNDQYLDLIARTAADEHAITEIQG